MNTKELNTEEQQKWNTEFLPYFSKKLELPLRSNNCSAKRAKLLQEIFCIRFTYEHEHKDTQDLRDLLKEKMPKTFDQDYRSIGNLISKYFTPINKALRNINPSLPGGKGCKPKDEIWAFLHEEFKKWSNGDDIFIEPPPVNFSIDKLVKELRAKIESNSAIINQCQSIQTNSPESDRPEHIEIDKLYTEVYMIDNKSENKRRNERIIQCNQESQRNVNLNMEQCIAGADTQETVSIQEVVIKNSKLVILGAPGSGKTTFSRWLTYQCIKKDNILDREGTKLYDFVPIYIHLQQFDRLNFDEPKVNIENYINEHIFKFESQNNQKLKQLLKSGRALIILDGLDEILGDPQEYTLYQVQNLIDGYSDNRFIITCRRKAKTFSFVGFKEVEIAPFNLNQIRECSQKWFEAHEKSFLHNEFMQTITTDCGLEIATNPLLLELLCYVFSKKPQVFDNDKWTLYKSALDTLLAEIRDTVNRPCEEAYRQLRVKQRENLLGEIAYNFFYKGEGEGEGEGSLDSNQKDLEKLIKNYIERVAVDVDPSTVNYSEFISSIERHHGIIRQVDFDLYSFSHYTFQDFLTARYITNSPPQSQMEALDKLAQTIVDRLSWQQWREVYLFAVGKPPADYLLKIMKKKIDTIVNLDSTLKEFFNWLKQKSAEVGNYHPPAIRAFYLARILGVFKCSKDGLNIVRSDNIDDIFDFYLPKSLDCNFELALNYAQLVIKKLSRARFDTNALALSMILCPELKYSLQPFHTDPRDPSGQEKNKLISWWEQINPENITNQNKEIDPIIERQGWTRQLRTSMLQYNDIGSDWQFNDEQIKKLQHYYDANCLLVDCLKSAACDRTTKDEIKENLLLPYPLPI